MRSADELELERVDLDLGGQQLGGVGASGCGRVPAVSASGGVRSSATRAEASSMSAADEEERAASAGPGSGTGRSRATPAIRSGVRLPAELPDDVGAHVAVGGRRG